MKEIWFCGYRNWALEIYESLKEKNNFKIIELNTDDVKNISYDFIKSNFNVNI